jgi:hypothetical protein
MQVYCRVKPPAREQQAHAYKHELRDNHLYIIDDDDDAHHSATAATAAASSGSL